MERIADKSGFTLIEVLLYIAIAGAISVVLVQAIDLIRNIRNRHIVAAEVNGHAEWAMRIINERMMDGELSAPSAGEVADRLSFSDGRQLLVENGRFIEQWATDAESFTSSAIAVSDVVFENLGDSSSDIVRIEFTASFNGTASTADDFQYSRTYETSITPLQ